MPAGEARRLAYKPGDKPNNSRPIPDEGDYDFSLAKIGKKGLKGWKTKPGKFPNRMLFFTVHGAEGPDGKDMEVPVWISPNPKVWFKVIELLAAYNYDGELDIQPPKNEKDLVAIKAACEELDVMLESLLDGEKTVRGSIAHEEYQNKPTARVTFSVPEDSEETEDSSDEEETEEAEAEDDGEDEDLSDDSDEETDDEEEKPRSKVKQGPASKAKVGKPPLKKSKR